MRPEILDVPGWPFCDSCRDQRKAFEQAAKIGFRVLAAVLAAAIILATGGRLAQILSGIAVGLTFIALATTSVLARRSGLDKIACATLSTHREHLSFARPHPEFVRQLRAASGHRDDPEPQPLDSGAAGNGHRLLLWSDHRVTFDSLSATADQTDHLVVIADRALLQEKVGAFRCCVGHGRPPAFRQEITIMYGQAKIPFDDWPFCDACGRQRSASQRTAKTVFIVGGAVAALLAGAAILLRKGEFDLGQASQAGSLLLATAAIAAVGTLILGAGRRLLSHWGRIAKIHPDPYPVGYTTFVDVAPAFLAELRRLSVTKTDGGAN